MELKTTKTYSNKMVDNAYDYQKYRLKFTVFKELQNVDYKLLQIMVFICCFIYDNLCLHIL